MSHDVFISYASSDRAAAEQVCAALETRGIRCWIAPRNVLPGEDWGMAILAAISAARCMVVVHSAATGNSIHVRNEVVTATSQRLPLVPVRTDEAPPGGALRLHLAAWHWLNAYPPPVSGHADMLANGVRASFVDMDTTVNLVMRRPGEGPYATPPPPPTTAAAPPRPVLPPQPPVAPSSTRPGGMRAVLYALGGLALVLAGLGAWYVGVGPGRRWIGLGGDEPAAVTLAQTPEPPAGAPADPPAVLGADPPADPPVAGGPTTDPPAGAASSAPPPARSTAAAGPPSQGQGGPASPPEDPPRPPAGSIQNPPTDGAMQPIDLGEQRPPAQQQQQQTQQQPSQQQQVRQPSRQPAPLVIHNAGVMEIEVLNVSPVTDTQWGENWLGQAQITPGNRVLVPRSAQSGCQFDIRIIWRDRRTEELRRQDLCTQTEYRFDGGKARPAGASR